MPDLPRRKPLPALPEGVPVPWTLRYAIFFEAGKHIGPDVPEYLSVVGQYNTLEAAESAMAIFKYWYPTCSFLLRDRETATDIVKLTHGVVTPEVKPHPKPKPTPSVEDDDDGIVGFSLGHGIRGAGAYWSRTDCD